MTARLILAVALATPVVLAGCQDVPTDSATTVSLALVTNADHGGRPYAVTLAQEVTSTPVYEGDADGSGEALITINVGRGEVCWHTTVSDVALPATASHIHHAPAMVRGAIAIALTPPDASGEVVGCRSDVDRALLRDILQQPEQYYVNVHTTEYPSGAVRSQLAK